MLPVKVGVGLDVVLLSQAHNNAVAHMADVLPHLSIRLLGIFPAERIQESPVFIEGNPNPSGYAHGGETKDADVIVQCRDEIDQALGVGELNHGLMKFEIFARITPDLEMHYEVDDFAEPWREHETVLLLHGNAESGEVWYGWMPHLAAELRVVRPDMRGFGRSTPMPRPPVGGIPCIIAWIKSMSRGCASLSPAARFSACSINRAY